MVIDAELLRPDQWILDNNVFVGSALPVHIAELDASGIAQVTGLAACKGLAAGDGEAVTGRFITRQVGETIHLTLIDGTVLEGTPVHPIWSVDRNDFVEMRELQPGERLQTSNGPLTIASVAVRHVPVPVYNIEVRGQHVYEVTDVGVLVHNATGCVTTFGEGRLRGVTHGPLKPGDIDQYRYFKKRAGDELEGHEVWQSANTAAAGLGGRTGSIGSRNPAIALSNRDHKLVNQIQGIRITDPRSMTPLENITANLSVLKEAQKAGAKLTDSHINEAGRQAVRFYLRLVREGIL